MRLQNVFTILALLALAALVFIVVRSISAPKPHPEAVKADRPAGPSGLPQIYVARETMEVGSFVSASDLQPHDWPQTAILPSQLRTDQVPQGDLAGAVVRERIVKGEPILSEKLARPGDRGFLAAVLRPGMRAVTIAIENVSSSHSGLLLPGDRIDVILTQNIGGTANGGRAHVGETIVRAVRVLAIGTALSRPDKADNIDDHPRSATLEVTPKQAEILSVAAQLGQISLALRSLPATESDEMEDELATTGADLTKPSAPTWGGDVSKAFSGGADVQIMRGSGEVQ